jgi:hypothetical protein
MPKTQRYAHFAKDYMEWDGQTDCRKTWSGNTKTDRDAEAKDTSVGGDGSDDDAATRPPRDKNSRRDNDDSPEYLKCPPTVLHV